MSSPHPELETLAQLADPALSTLSESELAAAREHLLTCPECSADIEALRAVHAVLGELPAVAIPADVAARLDASLDAVELDEPALGRGAGAASTATPITTLNAKRPGRRGWRPMPTSIAAGVAVLVFAALATAVALGSHGSSKSSSASSAASSVPRAAAGAVAPANQLVISSGTDYTTADFRTQIGAVLLSRVPSIAPFVSSSAAFPASAPAAASAAASSAAAAASTPSAQASTSAAAAGSSAAAPETFAAPSGPDHPLATTQNAPDEVAGSPLATSGWPLATGTALQACLDYLSGAPATRPVLVDHAEFNGVPATIITLRDPQLSSQLDVFVIADSMSCESGDVTYAAFLHASSGESASPSIG